MKITAIKQQVKRAGRYSLFVDGAYSFSLSDTAVLDSGIHIGLDINEQDLRAFKRLSDDDKIYNAALNYLALRPRSIWEIETYLTRKNASPSLIELILNKLTINKLLDDGKFAEAFIRDRQLLRPTSRRRLKLELQKRHISHEIINQVVNEDITDDKRALEELIIKKRRQNRYQDNNKLMQYLAAQGFGYGDIKQMFSRLDDPE